MGKLIDSFWEEINRQKEKQERELENRKKEKAFEELSNLDPNVLFNSGQKMIQEVNLPEEIFKNFIKNMSI